MRFVVIGAGAIGGLVGGRLAQHGHDVAFVARGRQLHALRSGGLRIVDPDGEAHVRVPTFATSAEVGIGHDDVVLVCVKGPETAGALTELAACTEERVPIFCLQNGVENERLALRLFEQVYGVTVSVPATFLEPGIVGVYCAPIAGILDIGRYPRGTDAMAEGVATAFGASGFSSVVRADIMRWKWRKLMTNLTNAIEAICGADARWGALAEMAVREAGACLAAEGIDLATPQEEAERRNGLQRMRAVCGQQRPGGSSWQSLARATGSIETDMLNGEIVLLGRLHGIPTPVNAHLQVLSRRLAHASAAPGGLAEIEVLADALAGLPAARSTWGPDPAQPGRAVVW